MHELEKKCLDIINNWLKLNKHENISRGNVEYEDGCIILKQGHDDSIDIYHYDMAHTFYDVEKKEMTGYVNYISEDLQEYLKKQGLI
tara:strand:+ start:339 stop:599 length:261 start_codon:yes stop_codon:yes gene_type:complete